MTEKQELKTDNDKTNERDLLALLEAALYVSGRPLEIKTLGSVLKIRSKKRIQALSRTLAQIYLGREGALELIELDDGRFALQLKPKYVQYVRRLSLKPLLSQSPLKTLSYIAYKQPVVQAHLAAVRGSQVYEHIKELRKLGLITFEKLGKTKVFRTTDIFADYFNLSHDTRFMKRQLKSLFEDIDKLQ